MNIFLWKSQVEMMTHKETFHKDSTRTMKCVFMAPIFQCQGNTLAHSCPMYITIAFIPLIKNKLREYKV